MLDLQCITVDKLVSHSSQLNICMLHGDCYHSQSNFSQNNKYLMHACH